MVAQSKRLKEENVGRSKRSRRRSNRSAKILTTLFSVVLVLSFVLSLVGPYVFRGSSEPTPLPQQVFPTVAPRYTATPFLTPTSSIPTPVLVTPTSSP
jgi:hypothetical protein